MAINIYLQVAFSPYIVHIILRLEGVVYRLRPLIPSTNWYVFVTRESKTEDQRKNDVFPFIFCFVLFMHKPSHPSGIGAFPLALSA